MRRVRVTALAALLLAGSAAAAVPSRAASVSACSPTGGIADAGRSWQALLPRFTSGPAEVTLAASPSYAPDVLYASNGTQVVRSTDAGCAWQVVLDTSRDGRTTTTATIRSLVAPSSANSSTFLYVGADAQVGVVSEPVVFVSPDRGGSWTAEAAGLPAVGAVRSLTVSPRLPQVAYALIAQDVADQAVMAGIWATTDAGRTWQQRSATGEVLDADLLEAAPRRENDVYALAGGQVRLSHDGGRTFTGAGPADARDVSSLDAAGGGGGVRMVAGHTGSASISRSDDGGTTWTGLPAPVVAQQVAMAPLQDVVAVGGTRSAWLLGGALRQEVTPDAGSPEQLQVSAPSARGFSLTGVAGGAVVRSAYSLRLQAIPPGRTPLRLLPYDPLHQFPSTLTPVSSQVSLPVGGTTTVPYRLLLPRTPSPLDVMFLVDSTGSMAGVIDALRQGITGIVSTLNGSGLDVRIGLGDFKDYAAPYGGGSRGDYPYRLVRRIGIADESLRQAIGRLEASGGGDGQESALTAVYQAATGKGETVKGVQFVAPGGQAGYRARTLRLDVVATDVEMRRRSDDERQSGTMAREIGHTVAETVAVLREHDIHAVGLAAGPGAEEDLRSLAFGSRTLAPAGGVDCDGDGLTDVRTGAPLVCDLDGSGAGVGVSVGSSGATAGTGGSGGTVNLAGAVIGMAEALPDHQRVAVRVTRGTTYAHLLGQPVRTRVNLKVDNEVDHVLRLTCPRSAGAGRHRVDLAATAGVRQVATAGVDLDCLAPAAVKGPPVDPPAEGPGAELNAAPAPPGQPPNAPNPNPNPNVNANANANPNLNGNPAAAAQEQQTQQLALVHAEAAGQGAEELAMSRAGPLPTAGVFVGAAGLLFVLASCLAARPRSAPAAVEQRLRG